MRAKEKPRQLLVKRRRAIELLDTSLNGVKKLEKLGKLTPVRLGSRDVCYRLEQFEALAKTD
jgi:hypothetical protein